MSVERDLHGVPKPIGPHGQPVPGDSETELCRANAEIKRLRRALSDLMPPLNNLKGYRCAERGPFLSHVEAIERRVVEALLPL